MQTQVRRRMFPMGRRPPVTSFALLLGLLAPGCGRVPPAQPIELIDQACCAEADRALTQFKGCIVGKRNCPKSHKWWMRGQVTCGAVGPECGGERCCGYLQQYDPEVGEPLEGWKPPGFPDPPTDEAPTDNADVSTDNAQDAAPPEASPNSTGPSAPAASNPPDSGLQITVALAGDGAASIQGDTLDPAALQTRLCEVAKALPNIALAIEAEPDTAKTAIEATMDLAKNCAIASIEVVQNTD